MPENYRKEAEKRRNIVRKFRFGTLKIRGSVSKNMIDLWQEQMDDYHLSRKRAKSFQEFCTQRFALSNE